MFVEGKGLVTPAPVTVPIDTDEMKHVLLRTEQVSKEKRYSKTSTMIGFLGEAAVAKHLYTKLDIRHLCNAGMYYGDGDGGVDIDVLGCRIQIKTHTASNKNLVPEVSNGKGRSFSSVDVFIFCQVDQLPDVPMRVSVKILGYIRTGDLMKVRESATIHGNRYRVVAGERLNPIAKLIALLNQYREAGKTWL